MAKIIRFEKISSTNREAKRLGLDGAADGTVVTAGEQTAGRGRLGRSWESPRGGLWMSMIVRRGAEEEMPAAAPVLSITAGVAAAETIAEIFSESGHDAVEVKLGWPNDVLVGDRKIAGILTEGCVIEHETPFAVVGVGMNVNNSPASMPGALKDTATSVSAVIGKEYPLEKALELLAAGLERRIADLRAGRLDVILDCWRARSALFGRQVKIQPHTGKSYPAVPIDIDDAGRLIVKTGTGEETAVESEEVTLIK